MLILAALFHPLLFALVPVVSLLSANIEVVAPEAALRPALLMVLVASGAFILLQRLLRQVEAAAAAVSLGILLLSQGLIREGLGGMMYWDTKGLVARAISILWMAAIGLAIYSILRSRTIQRGMSGVLLLVAIAMLVPPVIRIAQHETQLRQPWQPALQEIPGLPPHDPAGSPPDFYYIILDGYGREDVLADLYGIDNSNFLSALRDRGFYVAGASRSNYGQTSLSVASSLNLAYLDAVSDRLGSDSPDQRPIARLIRFSQLREILARHGYEFIALPTGYRRTEIDNADVYPRQHLSATTAFESQVLENLGLGPALVGLARAGVLSALPGYTAHRQRLEFAMAEIGRLATLPGPKFVFAHIVLPHPPFAYDAEGEAVNPPHLFQLQDGNEFPGSADEYRAGYASQIEYTNQRVLELVDEILAGASRPPVIVLQADHGPGAGLNWLSPETTDLRERMSILNAYYAPAASGALYEGITPVNSFRILLNEYLGYDLPLLPDRSEFSNWQRPYTFYEAPIEPADQ
ncbi:MAG: LTA synthase family protein [Anaerolineales bacterium]|nr:LTA synthase family protein [Anaerolineales bacterium]